MNKDCVTGDAFPEMKNSKILDAAFGKKQDIVPIWIMRQAGRYLPEYHTVRNKAKDFFDLCQTPALATEVTMQPIERYPLDASIVFSDILVIPQVLGLEVVMLPGKGPSFPSPLQTPDDLNKLKNSSSVNVKESLGYTLETVRLVRNQLDGRASLIGFCGAPWTLMAYMIEGEGSKVKKKSNKKLEYSS